MKAHCAVRDLNKSTHFQALQYTVLHGTRDVRGAITLSLVSEEQQTPPHQKYYNEKWEKIDISQLF